MTRNTLTAPVAQDFAAPEQNGALPARPSFAELHQGLLALDRLLLQALAAAEQAYGAQAANDPFRGLYLSSQDVDRLVQRAPGEALLDGGASAPLQGLLAGDISRLDWLRRRFRLQDFDLQALWLALAPEIEPRYERIYAYLQDDVTRRRPSVGLLLELLAPDPEQRLLLRERFSPAAPLLQSRLARLEPFAAGTAPGSGVLSSALALDESLVRFLLGPHGPDPRLVELCQWLPPRPAQHQPDSVLEEPLYSALRALSQAAPLRAHFQFAPGSDLLPAVRYLAERRAQAIFRASLPALLDSPLGAAPAVELFLRSAEFNHALALLTGVDALLGEAWLHRLLAHSQADLILAGASAWRPHPEQPLGLTQLSLAIPGVSARRLSWRSTAAAHNLPLPEPLLEELSQRFRLHPGQVRGAVAMLAASRQTQGADALQRQDWLAAARLQTGQALQVVAQKITPRQHFDDLVLPPDSLAQLHEMAARVTAREFVLDQWGFGQRMSLGRGVTALFAGPPGTGKTMAAEVVASALGLDLYRIDLARVVSKYIGETEKNLNAVFSAAEDSNAILFFDEADALFGKRSEVQDAHDRYANIEVAYLLQKMEQYEGAAILATNMRQNLDEAFMRRLSFVISFPFPDEDARRRIWQGIWPEQAPLDRSLDFDWLARRFRLSGGNIRNIALAAAYLASQDGGRVTQEHLLTAVRREYHKLGKTYPEAERADRV